MVMIPRDDYKSGHSAMPVPAVGSSLLGGAIVPDGTRMSHCDDDDVEEDMELTIPTEVAQRLQFGSSPERSRQAVIKRQADALSRWKRKGPMVMDLTAAADEQRKFDTATRPRRTRTAPEAAVSPKPLKKAHAEERKAKLTAMNTVTVFGGVRRKPRKCVWCAKEYPRSSFLSVVQNHQKYCKLNPNRRPSSSCETCKREFRDPYSLLRHMQQSKVHQKLTANAEELKTHSKHHKANHRPMRSQTPIWRP